MKTSLLVIAVALVAASSQNHVSKNSVPRNLDSSSKRFHPRKALPREAPEDDSQAQAKLARKLVHESDWASVSTHSTLQGFEDYPATNVQLIADGNTGNPYWYISKEDQTYKDFMQDQKASILFSQAAIDDSCKKLKLGAKDPKCPRVLFMGNMVSVINDAKECETAWKALKAKYPELDNLPEDDYYIGKLDITAIWVHGKDGSAQQLPLEDYQNATP